ncbi:MAG: tRNA 2-thiocytidine biosynthesis TtcA family protein [Culicoidibacterales bacterium]
MTKLASPTCPVIIPNNPLKSVKEIERSLQKTYGSDIWGPFMKAIYDYKLIKDGDHIAVAISGGKDSLLMAKLFQHLERIGIFELKVSFIAMDPGFNEANRQNLEKNLKALEIDCDIYGENIFERAESRSAKYPCYLCARMRRGSLYAKATSLGCNKLALGHHLDDVVETVMMNILYAGKFETMLPILPSDNFDIELIRPLYYIEEKNIIRFTKSSGITAMNCGCTVAAAKTASKRREIKELIANLEKGQPDVKKCILSSTKKVNVSKLLFGLGQEDKGE